MIDLAAARYCAQLTAQLYAGRPIPGPIRRHIEQLLSGSVDGTECVAGQQESTHETFIDTAAAAQILGCSTRYVRKISRSLDGDRIAGRWVFRESAVRDYTEGRHRD